jgi:NADPH-dependent curcumin reductase CurA
MKRWVLARRPLGETQPGDLELVEEPIRDLVDGEVLIRVSPEP